MSHNTQEGEPSFSPRSRNHIGVFYERDLETGALRTIDVYANQEIIIGRSPTLCQHIIDKRTISKKHLRIYSIIFDQANPGEVAPLVYAEDLSSVNGTFWNDRRILKNTGGTLLGDGDTLRIMDVVELKFRCAKVDDEHPFTTLQAMEMQSFAKHYAVTNRKLGAGAFGQVHMAVVGKQAKQLACKIIDIRNLRERLLEPMNEDTSGVESVTDTDSQPQLIAIKKRSDKTKYMERKLEFFHREADILKNLHHPNIITVERVIKTSNTMYIFQELITAGDLFSFLEYKKGKLLDIEVAVIIRQVVLALEYLHNKNVVHRDVKPDNILMTSLSTGSRVVLTDFGCARFVPEAPKRMTTAVGTPDYAAPEMTDDNSANETGYTKAVDLWSVGCVTHVLLTGAAPFTDPITNDHSQKLAHECDLKKLELDADWRKAGERAKDFVRRLLVLDESKRMTAKEALEHEWFTNPAHKKEFEDLYRRAVRNWKPRSRKGSILFYDRNIGIGRRDSPRPVLQSKRRLVPAESPYKPFARNLFRWIYPKIKNSRHLLGLGIAKRSSTAQTSSSGSSKDGTAPKNPGQETQKKSNQIPMAQVWGRMRLDMEVEDTGTVPPSQAPSGGSTTKGLKKNPPPVPVPEWDNIKDPKGESKFYVMCPPLATKPAKINGSMGGEESFTRRPFSQGAWVTKANTPKPPPKSQNGNKERSSKADAKGERAQDMVKIPKYLTCTKPKGDSLPNASLKRAREGDDTPNPKKAKYTAEQNGYSPSKNSLKHLREEDHSPPSKKAKYTSEESGTSSKNGSPSYPCVDAHMPSPKRKRNDPEDQVFEEVDDGISGKRRRVAYGEPRK